MDIKLTPTADGSVAVEFANGETVMAPNGDVAEIFLDGYRKASAHFQQFMSAFTSINVQRFPAPPERAEPAPAPDPDQTDVSEPLSDAKT